MNDSILLVCPHCEKRGERNVLGAVDSYGRLIIKRTRKNTNGGSTIITSSEMTICCNCGFGTTINSKSIQTYTAL